MNKSQLIDTLHQIQGHKVLVIGDVMVDAYVWGSVDRISPEAPVPVVTVKNRTHKLGGAANVAFNIKSLGADPILCSVIGKDTKGEEFLQLLQNQDLSTLGIVRSENRITTTKFRVLGNNVQMLRVDEEDLSPIIEEDSDTLKKQIKSIIELNDIKAIVFEDYDKGVISEELINYVSKLASKKGIYISADPKRNNFPYYQNITMLKPNLKELNEGLNLQIENGKIEEITVAARALLDKHHLEEVLVTLSEHGLLTVNKTESHHIPTQAKGIVDVSGAGDTVISALTLMRMSGIGLEESAIVANLAGGIVCEEVGVVPIGKENLIKAITEL